MHWHSRVCNGHIHSSFDRRKRPALVFQTRYKSGFTVSKFIYLILLTDNITYIVDASFLASYRIKSLALQVAKICHALYFRCESGRRVLITDPGGGGASGSRH